MQAVLIDNSPVAGVGVFGRAIRGHKPVGYEIRLGSPAVLDDPCAVSGRRLVEVGGRIVVIPPYDADAMRRGSHIAIVIMSPCLPVECIFVYFYIHRHTVAGSELRLDLVDTVLIEDIFLTKNSNLCYWLFPKFINALIGPIDPVNEHVIVSERIGCPPQPSGSRFVSLGNSPVVELAVDIVVRILG